MEKINKFKSIFLKTAISLGPVSSLAILTSCFSNANHTELKSQKDNPLHFETENDNTIDFRVIFGPTDPRTQALSAIFEKWNQKSEVKDKQAGFLPVKLEPSAANYIDDQTNLVTFLEVKDTKKLPNLTLNYPALAASLNKHGMILDLNSQSDLAETIKNSYDERFLVETKNVPGIDQNTLAFLPILKTSKALLLDKPVLSYILESAKTSPNFKISESDKTRVENLDPKKTDLEYIKKVWGEYKSFSSDQGGFDGYTFSFEKFNNYKDLIDFLSRVRKSFPDAEKGNQTEKVNFLLGLNDTAALFFFVAFAQADGEYEKSSYFKNLDGASLNYTNLFDEATKNHQNTKKAYEILSDLVKNKLLGPTSGRTRASEFLKNHQLVFAITSTSDYSRNFEKQGQNFLRLKVNTKTFDYPVGSKSKIWKIVNEENMPANAIAKVHQILDNSTGYVYEADTFSVKENDIFLSKTDDKDLIEKIKNAIKSKTNLNSFNFLAIDPDFDKWVADKTKEDSQTSSLYVESAKNKVKLFNQPENTFIFSKSHQKLNEDELEFLNEPSKTQESNKFNIVTSQGPSLIGFYNNEVENEATLNFIKWFISEKIEFDGPNNKKMTVTPSDFLAFSASNINPTKANLESNFDQNPAFAKNNAFKVAYEQFQNQLKNPEKYRVFTEPAGIDSNTFRKATLGSVSQLYNQFLANPNLNLEFNTFLKILKDNIGASVKLNKDKTEKNTQK
ncbi:P68 family surface lipoprotein [Mesomycoplasma ovipneumoniae]|uniref:P68 family surface lipoprotein n=1 Tax=Mesomycoplasma ovipneumoniae TaxID=29562 RepID=UPI00296455F8|nr:P80 family lipoprotein [Mesomycoplasma ovipneumoniae]MDW2910485.1 P80 family lipoprotein [Mesomycoplasma ovipneumoniae]MDW2917733.1 P80 family lipoprotein [Mesomycoplasma ovipneumoniae]